MFEGVFREEHDFDRADVLGLDEIEPCDFEHDTDGKCPECNGAVEDGICQDCGFDLDDYQPDGNEFDPGEMDGDHETALASAGIGLDESYE